MNQDPATPFKEPKNLGVYSLRSIVYDGHPILHVTHDADDGAWQFLEWEDALTEDGVLVSLEHIIHLDPSITALAALPTGWHAFRPSPTAPGPANPTHPSSAPTIEPPPVPLNLPAARTALT